MSEAEPVLAEPSKAARNERLKLSATLLNNLAVAFFIAALLQPVLRALQEGQTLRGVELAASLGFGSCTRWRVGSWEVCMTEDQVVAWFTIFGVLAIAVGPVIYNSWKDGAFRRR